MRFDVIVGPSGSSKMYSVRKICSEFPKEVLYYDVHESDTLYQDLKRLALSLHPLHYLI